MSPEEIERLFFIDEPKEKKHKQNKPETNKELFCSTVDEWVKESYDEFLKRSKFKLSK